VTVSGGRAKQIREIRSGGSFLSQNDLRAYFGLGDYAGPVDIEIRMPGGRRWAGNSFRATASIFSGSRIQRASLPPALLDDVAVLTPDDAAPDRRPAVGVCRFWWNSAGGEQADYRPKLAVSQAVEPFLKQLEPGNDGFPLERQAAELDARLRELSDALRGGGDRAADATKGLLDPGFRGARLVALEAAEANQGPLEVKRTKDLPHDPTLDARAFGAELRRLMDDVRDVATAEFLITAIEAEGPADASGLRTTVRYDIVGAGTQRTASSTSASGRWGWRRNASGWQVVRWTAASHVVSRRDSQSSRRSPRRRSGATTRSAASSTSISTRGWRRSTRS
jgi:ASPIC and UnbV.